MNNVGLLTIGAVLIAAVAAKPQQCSMLRSLKVWNDYDYMNCTVTVDKTQFPLGFNITFDVFQKLESLSVSMDLSIKTQTQQYSLMNVTIDLCKLFSNKKQDAVSALLTESFKKSETYFRKCPVEKGMYYIVYDRTNTNSSAKIPMPKGNFLAKVTYMTLVDGQYKFLTVQDFDFLTDPGRNKKNCKTG